jgi:hypothetical protein
VTDAEVLELVELAEEAVVAWAVDGFGTGIEGVPVSETILPISLMDVEATRMLDGKVDDIEVAVVLNVVTERKFVDVIVMVIVPTVSATALGIAKQMLYTLLSSTASLLGQFDTRH